MCYDYGNEYQYQSQPKVRFSKKPRNSAFHLVRLFGMETKRSWFPVLSERKELCIYIRARFVKEEVRRCKDAPASTSTQLFFKFNFI